LVASGTGSWNTAGGVPSPDWMRSHRLSRKLGTGVLARQAQDHLLCLLQLFRKAVHGWHSAACCITVARRPDGSRPSRHCDNSCWQVLQFIRVTP